MFCTNCGSQVEDNTNFCPKCGAKIVHEAKQDTHQAPVQSDSANTENVPEKIPETVSEPSYPPLNTTSEAINEQAPAEKEDNPTSIIVTLIIALGVFAWNSYVIVNNLSIGDGYAHAIGAIVINLAILCWAPINMAKLGGGNNKGALATVGIAILVVTFIIAGPVLGNPSGKYEDKACELVTQIIHDNLGRNGAKCIEVQFTRHPSDNLWIGEALLDNTNSLGIVFTRKGDSVFVQIPNW